MRKPENVFKERCAVLLRHNGWFVQNFESGGTGLGIADQYALKDGCGCWIEYKDAKGGSWPCDRKISFERGQYPWLMDVAKNGGRAFVWIKYANGSLLLSIEEVNKGTKRPESGLFLSPMSATLVEEKLKGPAPLLAARGLSQLGATPSPRNLSLQDRETRGTKGK